MLVWSSLHVAHIDHKYYVSALHANFACSCLQTREFLKYTARVTKYMRVLHSHASKQILTFISFDCVSLPPAITDQIKPPADKHVLVTLNY